MRTEIDLAAILARHDQAGRSVAASLADIPTLLAAYNEVLVASVGAKSDHDRHDPRCQSAHSGCCYGVLWQCDNCQRIVCCAEGTDDMMELCDDCWSAEYSD